MMLRAIGESQLISRGSMRETFVSACGCIFVKVKKQEIVTKIGSDLSK